MRRSAVATLLVLATAVLLSACGGEPARAPVSAAAAETPALTDPARRAYVRRVDRVCRELDPKREAKLREVEGAANAEAA